MKLPQQLLDSLNGMPGFNSRDFVDVHMQKERITSIRLNPFKKIQLDFKTPEPVKWCEDAFYLSERPSFTHDPLFHAGCYYVQEAGSMFIEHALKSVLNFSERLSVLDLCAAPGGKSTLINSLLGPESLLVANEVVSQRAGILAANLGRWGTRNTIVTNNDPKDFSRTPSFFDALVIDAPCSGSGLFRKQPDAILEWSEENVQMCSSRQKRILADALPSLKTNGILVYSTCSYSVEENEDIVKWLITEFGFEYVPLRIEKNWGIMESHHGYRFYPHLTASEGFFCAVLRKNSDPEKSKRTSKSVDYLLKKEEKLLLSHFIDENGLFLKHNNDIHLANERILEFIGPSAPRFHLKKAGVNIGEIKGKDLVPDQDLAWFAEVKTEKTLDLDKEECLKYLKKQAFTAVSPPGLALISYRQKGLGWAKILPNRINNYLPNELRILN